jgi:hypothetical protein
MSFVEINPIFRSDLAEAGLVAAVDFFALAGEPVRIRPHRRVDRIERPNGLTAFLKR